MSDGPSSPLFTFTFFTPLGAMSLQGTDYGLTALSIGEVPSESCDAAGNPAEQSPIPCPSAHRPAHRSAQAFSLKKHDQRSHMSNGPGVDPLHLVDKVVLPSWLDETVRLLQAYSQGEPVSFRSIPLDVEHRTPFERRVREQLQLVGYGETVSYGQLAALAGRPGAARAVGTVMRRNPLPLIIPCHRVIAAGGKLGGYSAASGVSMKSRLLSMESQGQKCWT